MSDSTSSDVKNLEIFQHKKKETENNTQKTVWRLKKENEKETGNAKQNERWTLPGKKRKRKARRIGTDKQIEKDLNLYWDVNTKDQFD